MVTPQTASPTAPTIEAIQRARQELGPLIRETPAWQARRPGLNTSYAPTRMSIVSLILSMPRHGPMSKVKPCTAICMSRNPGSLGRSSQ